MESIITSRKYKEWVKNLKIRTDLNIGDCQVEYADSSISTLKCRNYLIGRVNVLEFQKELLTVLKTLFILLQLVVKIIDLVL